MQRCILAILSLAFCAGAQAVSEDVQLNLVTTQGVGQTIGSVKITETDRGLEFAPTPKMPGPQRPFVFAPTLRALPPGKHGFHIHAEGSCQPAMKEGKAVAAGAAGGHYDPQHTGKHEGPLGAGHLGDLPLLVVNDAGVADQPIIAPRLKTLAEVKGKALMVHVGGDNMADSPQPLGGGGERFACGVIK
ncbi:superoxide dismutase [Cu-Zn] SodC2 [Klebsiella pneumoniae]|nr:superoxide dismutase [Cu-Zn] SodC2 [Klebsiella pneumoniae]